MLPPVLGKHEVSHSVKPLETASVLPDLKVVGLADTVEGRINVIVNNGQVCNIVHIFSFWAFLTPPFYMRN